MSSPNIVNMSDYRIAPTHTILLPRGRLSGIYRFDIYALFKWFSNKYSSLRMEFVYSEKDKNNNILNLYVKDKKRAEKILRELSAAINDSPLGLCMYLTSSEENKSLYALKKRTTNLIFDLEINKGLEFTLKKINREQKEPLIMQKSETEPNTIVVTGFEERPGLFEEYQRRFKNWQGLVFLSRD